MAKVLIISANFYPHISAMLLEGAGLVLRENNIEFEVIEVAGALEIPAVIAFASSNCSNDFQNNFANKVKNVNEFSGFIALGCVIRGETYHFEVVCNESARSLQELALSRNLAIANGILTVENEAQALRRADINQLNKGEAVAKACIDLIKLKKRFS